ncbi:hypothetical protein SPI_03693 [Niveomyces insectorum RCEF 264]|uniref:Aminoglycoside phosphotransferase n=1 Tax=Niveomyces insectorum RCEF 264 TaxID=1081102 RepID=A0A162ML25_9HYPO|nr:hypothetical protein SPI_03693 [Niveomyces insectorum RCEF 264]
MATTIPASKGELFDYEAAVESQRDVLTENRNWLGFKAFVQQLGLHGPQLKGLAAFHLGVDPTAITVCPLKEWKAGAFNVAVVLSVRDECSNINAGGDNDGDTSKVQDSSEANESMQTERRIIVRCPIPSSCAEAHYPGTILEKMRCEVASYIWMRRFCPEIRIPQLYGFGLPNGRHVRATFPIFCFSIVLLTSQFTMSNRVSFFRRLWLYVRQKAAHLFGWPVPSSYVTVPPSGLSTPDNLAFLSGYMVLECFGPPMGRLLPKVVGTNDIDPQDPKAQNLYRSLARLMLAIGRIRQPKIGAFRFHYDGTISLDNRPFTCPMMIMENEKAPRTIPSETTYTSVDSYVADMMAFHDASFLAAPNATDDEDDCRNQLSVRTFLRAASSRFVSRERHNGPFSLWMSDDNTCNLFVDDNWNITGLIDLEWMVSVPVDMQCTPFWLYSMEGNSEDTTRSEEARQKYLAARSVFMSILRDEEIKQDKTRGSVKRSTGQSRSRFLPGSTLSDAIDDSWTSGRFWFYLCLQSPNAMHNVVHRNILPDYLDDENVFSKIWRFWGPNVSDVVAKKLRDRKEYVEQLSKLFNVEVRDNTATSG